MFRKIGLAAALLGSLAIAHASNWQLIATPNSGDIEIDLSSVSRSGSLVKIWLRRVYPNGFNDGSFAKPVSIRQVRWIIDCQRRSVAQGEIVLYDMQHEILFQTRGAPNDFEDVTPDSTGEAIADRLCKQ
ncbi:surface-adhesin E family protein [Paraburkholderia terrae]|uniref:surface-adhesin E family protein n=1 Tax=Paraburkholderia terrae TaxID=311230 RepID=UPI001EE2BCF2|nr:surface-adhesin E family protein [Paraburkholderia terrae]GJH04502.1 hypothetical protein CBA19C8_28115 [Paraburkholderia terrae]